MWVLRPATNDARIINGNTFKMRVDVPLVSTGLTSPKAISFSNEPNETNNSLGMPPMKTVFISMAGTEAMNYADAGVVILDAQMRMIEGQVATHNAIDASALKPDSTELWALAGKAKQVVLIDTAAKTVTTSIAIDGTADLVAIRFASTGAKAYVATRDAVVEIDTAQKSVLGKYETGMGTSAIVISPDDKTMWVANDTANTVQKIDLTVADRAAAVTPFASGVGGASSLSLGQHVITSAATDAKVLFFDDKGTKVSEVPISGRPADVSVSPDCSKAYALDVSQGQLSQIDAKKLILKGSVAIESTNVTAFGLRIALNDM